MVNDTGKIIVVRHASYRLMDESSDPALSEEGKEQAQNLGRVIAKILSHSIHSIEIWSSPALRARGTAEIIKNILGLSEINSQDKLWWDDQHPSDIGWFRAQLEEYRIGNLVVVTHKDYLGWFSHIKEVKDFYGGYATGVCFDRSSNQVATLLRKE